MKGPFVPAPDTSAALQVKPTQSFPSAKVHPSLYFPDGFISNPTPPNLPSVYEKVACFGILMLAPGVNWVRDVLLAELRIVFSARENKSQRGQSMIQIVSWSCE